MHTQAFVYSVYVQYIQYMYYFKYGAKVLFFFFFFGFKHDLNLWYRQRIDVERFTEVTCEMYKKINNPVKHGFWV